MKARTSTVLLLALTMALVACGRTESPDVRVDPVAATAPSSRDTGLPGVARSAAELAIPVHETELTALADQASESTAEPVSEPTPAIVASYSLRHGESLHHFAKWSGLAVEEIALASGLDLSGQYAAGVTVKVPLSSTEQRGTIDNARDAHHSRRAEGYLASRGGAIGAEFVTVATGDSATSIARQRAGIPLWLLQVYNPSVDLDRLRPGQELMIPIVADIVVDAGEVDEGE